MTVEFDVNTTFANEIPVINISGEITSEAEGELLSCYKDIPEKKKGRVILEFSNTKYINSAGIAVLINLINRASEKNYNIEFVGLNQHFRMVMDIVGLSDFVTIHEKLIDALNTGKS